MTSIDKTSNINKNIKIILISFILIQPLLDTHYLFSEKAISILGVSPSTVIRFFTIAFLFLLTFYSLLKEDKLSKKYYFIGYFVIVGIYFTIHHLNAIRLESLVPGNFNYSISSELNYILVLLLPFFITFITYFAGVNDNDFRKTILYLVILISGSIVITNLFKISLSSYDNTRISDNIFSWFGDAYKHYSYFDLASKSFFNFANQVAAILCMLLPLTIYFLVVKTDFLSITSFLLQAISMLMLGTKVAAYGFVLILITMFVFYLFFALIKKEFKLSWKTCSCFLCTLAIFLIIFPKSPAIYKQQIADNTAQKYKYTDTLIEDAEKDNQDDQDDDHDNKKKFYNLNHDEKVKFIKKYYPQLCINPTFILNSYPYKYDPDFWYEIMKKPVYQRLNYRFIEEQMLIRVKEINDNKMDDFFGIGVSRVRNIFNVERDYLNQYYSIGILGVLLFLMPFTAILLLGGYMCLSHYKDKFTFANISLLSAIALPQIAAFYSGNTIDALFTSLILGFVCGIFLKNIYNEDGFSSNENISDNANLQ